MSSPRAYHRFPQLTGHRWIAVLESHPSDDLSCAALWKTDIDPSGPLTSTSWPKMLHRSQRSETCPDTLQGHEGANSKSHYNHTGCETIPVGLSGSALPQAGLRSTRRITISAMISCRPTEHRLGDDGPQCQRSDNQRSRRSEGAGSDILIQKIGSN